MIVVAIQIYVNHLIIAKYFFELKVKSDSNIIISCTKDKFLCIVKIKILKFVLEYYL